jgi:uncharacterized protein DUF5655/uncharacterized protein DUF4287
VAKRASIYSVHPGVSTTRKWIASLPEKTGRSLDEWLDLVKKQGGNDEVSRREWLKKEHGLGTNAAWWIAERSVGKGLEASDPEAYLSAAERDVDAMFAGKRATLRPLYDALLKLGLAVGKDAKACPCQTMVPLYRNHVFAQIKPATSTRIDFGLALGDTRKTTRRLIDTGGYAKKDRITHRFEITAPADIDDQVRSWLKTAYDRDL